MTTPNQFKRCDWSARDVEKWNARLTEILGRRLGTTDLPEVDWDAVNAEAAAEWRRNKAAVLLGRLSERHRDATPRHALSLRWLAAYDEGRMVNLAITGLVGVGKTWEAAAIVRALLLDREVPAQMTSVPDMMDKLRPTQDGATDIGQFQCAPVLVLDDLGAEKRTEWTDEQLFRVADFRHNRNLPTIVTSNLGPDHLVARYGDRLARRLFEDAAHLEIKEQPPQVPVRFGAKL